eukprot:TRINITY_DN67927_c5_g2_i1.p1 TRINITY_DN67927_c5_g2~~TRINITY_DN67927_c5_g2_i1.p1  ORF type:complete len:343 (+),score=6.86 TRINITY_DN67927_c5_g2_i1:65-1093(+)
MSMNFVVSKKESTDQRVSHGHWQLKDLICSPLSNPNIVYYVTQARETTGARVRQYNFETDEDITVLKTLYQPTAMTVQHDYVVTVGVESELTVKNLSQAEVHERRLQCLINNACVIHKHDEDDLRLLVCTNGQKIKVFDLCSLQLLCDIRVGTQVNHCAVSPDGKTLVAVGDQLGHVYIYSIENFQYTQQHDLKVHDDCAFSCCFTPSGDHFLIAAQDGTVLSFETKNPKARPRVLNHRWWPSSPQPSILTDKCCRVVKYSPKFGIDLVAFTETKSVVHIMCMWDTTQHQAVWVAPENVGKDVQGICFSTDAEYLYVALEDRIVQLSLNLLACRCGLVALGC